MANELTQAIEDKIMYALFMIMARRQAQGEVKGEVEADRHEILEQVGSETDSDVSTDGIATFSREHVDLLQLILKQNLPENILVLLAKLFSHNPELQAEAYKALVKILTATNSPHRLAIVKRLTKAALSYTAAEEVLRESLNKGDLNIRKELTDEISNEETVALTLNVARPRYPSPRPSPFKKGRYDPDQG